jgi:uncharacterized protein YqgC (DUF456 family)
MLGFTLLTMAIFGVGYWSAWMRIKQVGGEALPLSAKLIMAVLGALCALAAYALVSIPGLGVIIAEFFVLCAGQTLGYILSGKPSDKSKKN